MDLFSAIQIAIVLFVVFVLLTAYFLKSYIVMNSIDNKGEDDGSLDKEEPSVIPEPDGQK